LLSLLSAVYACTIADLLDLADHEHMRPADLLILGKAAPAGGRVEPSVPARPGREERVGTLAADGESDDVRRSEFLMVAGTALAGALAPPLVHEWWPGMHDPGPPQPTDLMLAQIRAQIEGFRWLDRKQGSYGLLPHTARYARRLVGLWRLTDEANPQRRDLAAVAADACHLVAYQAYDQGERARATEWYRCAAGLADRGSAKDLYVFAVCGVAYMHARNDDGELALSVLHQLAPLGLSAAARCYVAVYEAHAYASMRQQPSALRALDRAVEYTTWASGEAPSPWLGIPDSAFAERQRAMILAGFGSPRALPLLERLSRHTPDIFQRYRVTLLTDRAMAHACLGDADAATDLLARALCRNESSAERRAQILAVRQVLGPHDSASVRALDEVLKASNRTAHRPEISQ
jgi:tetratricopeptide (TPR) repeat protein